MFNALGFVKFNQENKDNYYIDKNDKLITN